MTWLNYNEFQSRHVETRLTYFTHSKNPISVRSFFRLAISSSDRGSTGSLGGPTGKPRSCMIAFWTPLCPPRNTDIFENENQLLLNEHLKSEPCFPNFCKIHLMQTQTVIKTKGCLDGKSPLSKEVHTMFSFRLDAKCMSSRLDIPRSRDEIRCKQKQEWYLV